MYTKANLWKIVNNTRYNTEDIVDLFNRAEDFLTEHDGPPVTNRTKPEGQVMFRDFSPTVMTFTRRVYPSMELETVRSFVRGAAYRTRHMRDVGLIKPSKLYDNHMESLAAPRVDGQEVVPQEFLWQVLWDIVMPCYVHGHRRDFIQASGILDGAKIRVEKRRQEPRDQNAGRAEKVQRLTREFNPTYWALMSAASHVESISAAQTSLQEKYDDLRMTRRTTPELIQACLQGIRELQVAMYSDETDLRQERE